MILGALIAGYFVLAKYQSWWPFEGEISEYIAPEFLSFISEGGKIDKDLAVKLSRNENPEALLTVRQKSDKQAVLSQLGSEDYEFLEDFFYSETVFIRIKSISVALKLLNDSRVLNLKSDTPAVLY